MPIVWDRVRGIGVGLSAPGGAYIGAAQVQGPKAVVGGARFPQFLEEIWMGRRINLRVGVVASYSIERVFV